jgi:zinc/manganese transport system ATP-binding protein
MTRSILESRFEPVSHEHGAAAAAGGRPIGVRMGDYFSGYGIAAMTVELHNVTLGYGGHPAVHHLTGKFSSGSLTAVVGPNGSGKSTLLKGLAGLLQPIDGRIVKQGLDAADIAYLPQASSLDQSFPATVSDLVRLGLWAKRGLAAGFTAEDERNIANALARAGLSGFESRSIETLSGGQLQRALFARVMLQDARVILLDEPFTAIDAKAIHELVHVVKHWHDEGRTVIAVLHDYELVQRHFPETLLLAREPVAWGPTADVLTVANQNRARQMHEAWDEHAPWCVKDAA